jgi:hypothetical protein
MSIRDDVADIVDRNGQDLIPTFMEPVGWWGRQTPYLGAGMELGIGGYGSTKGIGYLTI